MPLVTSTGLWHRLTTNSPLDCPSLRNARAKLKGGIRFNLQKQSVPECDGASLVKKPHLDAKSNYHQGGRKSAGGVSTVQLILGRSKPWWMVFLRWYSLQPHHHHLHPLCRFVYFHRFFISGVTLLPIGLCLIWLQVTIFNLGATPLFHNFRWFNTKATMAHHPIIQKEVDEMLAKYSTEPSTGGVGFYSYLSF